MDQVCGIYKITNLVNNKCYIGQSINISSRWKQHTQSLEKVIDPDGENPLRRAFLKYGLMQQVSQPGTYGNFKFEVLLECDRDKLTENEYAKIDEIQPEYNRMMCPPSADRMWPRKKNLEKCCYVQYHNFDDMGYLPYEGLYFRDMVEDSSYISTKKRDGLKLKGENVYLIVGIKQKGHKKKDFYLWDYTQVEEVEIKDYGDNIEYGLSGSHFICPKPIRLNDLPGFEHFYRNTMGCFAYGFQNAINDPFAEFLMDESHYTPLKKYNKSCLEWLADFEDELDDATLWLTEKDDDDKPSWYFFFELIDDDFSECGVTQRAKTVVEFEPDFFVEEFEKYKKEHPEVKIFHSMLTINSVKIAKKIPSVHHRIYTYAFKEDFHEDWYDDLRKLSSMKNVSLLDANGEIMKI